MDRLRSVLARLFNRSVESYVFFLEAHCVHIAAFIFFLSILLGSGLRFWSIQSEGNAEKLYTPTTGNFVKERQISFEHWPLDPFRFVPGRTYDLKSTAAAIIVLKSNASLMEQRYMDEVLNFNDEVMEGIVVHDRFSKSKTFLFDDLCLKYEGRCAFTNQHLKMLDYAMKHNKLDNLTFPRWEILKNSPATYVGYLIGGVDLAADKFHIEQFRAFFLIYYLRYDSIYRDRSLDWENEFVQKVKEKFVHNKSSIYNVAYWHSRALSFGMNDYNVVDSSRKVVVCIVLLGFMTVAFCMNITKRENGNWRFDWVNSKAFLGICGLMSAVLAIVTAIGIWALVGGSMTGTMQIVTFLSLAIGVDDMFVMMAAWINSDHLSTVNARMVHSLKHSIHSITITSLTSFLSFLIGSVSNFLGIKIFCTVMALSLGLNYIYQLTFYTACMYLAGIIEQHGLVHTTLYFVEESNAEGSYKKMMNGSSKHLNSTELQPFDTQTNSLPGVGRSIAVQQEQNTPSIRSSMNGKPKRSTHADMTLTDMDSQDDKSNHAFKSVYSPKSQLQLNSNDPVTAFIYNTYSSFLIQKSVKTAAFLMYLVYLAIAIYGCANVKEGLDAKRMAPPSVHISNFYNLLYDYFYTQGQQVEFIVNNPPDLMLNASRKLLHKMVTSLENKEHTMSRNATDFFLRDYELFLENTGSSVKDTSEIWEANLFHWSTLNSYRRSVEADLKWTPVPGRLRRCVKCENVLTAFRFRIGIIDFAGSTNQRKVLHLVRDLVQNYSHYNITTYQQEWPWIEQYDGTTKMAIWTIALAILTMLVVATIFFQSFYCVFWTIFAVISIDVGVIGFMSYMHVNLDFISIVVIIMSIGLSVDYTAHIVHGFKVGKGSVVEKVKFALAALGLAVLQGALTSLFGLLPMVFAEGYVTKTFFKVTALSIVFGMAHACFLLPIALSSSQQLLLRIYKRMEQDCGKQCLT